MVQIKIIYFWRSTSFEKMDSKTMLMSLKEQGNDFYKKGSFLHAIEKYSEALKILMSPEFNDSKTKSEQQHLILSNRALSYLQIGQNEKALEDANECLKLSPKFIKGYCRKIQALLNMEAMDDAEKELKVAFSLDSPDNKDLLEYQRQINAYKSKFKKQTENKQNEGKNEEEEQDVEDVISEDIFNFAQQVISEIIQLWNFRQSNEKLFRAKAYLLPKDPEAEQTVISIENAFQSPELNLECIYFLRDLIKQENIKACLLIAQKSTLFYPQKWRSKSKQQWPFNDDQDGLFIELETINKRSGSPIRLVHFLPIEMEGGKLVDTQGSDMSGFALDAELFCLFPALYSDKLEIKFV